MQHVEADGNARGARHAVHWRQHARSVEDQQGVREIARAENADAQQQAPEGNRQRFEVQ